MLELYTQRWLTLLVSNVSRIIVSERFCVRGHNKIIENARGKSVILESGKKQVQLLVKSELKPPCIFVPLETSSRYCERETGVSIIPLRLRGWGGIKFCGLVLLKVLS